MAEKEERIVIHKQTQYNPPYGGWCGNGKEIVLPRKKAVEIMAKAIHFYEWGHHNNMPKWDELNEDIQNDYKNMAEAALNALLGEK